MTGVSILDTDAILAHVPGRRSGDTGRRSGSGSRGQGLVTFAPGRLRQDTPGRHDDRSASACSWTRTAKARVIPAVRRGPGVLRLTPCDARGLSNHRDRARGGVLGSAWLKLSGGVRSLPQAPWWNADRRAAPSCVLPRKRGRMKVGAEPRDERGGYGTASIGVPLPVFIFCSPDGAQRNPGAAFRASPPSRITLRSIRATD